MRTFTFFSVTLLAAIVPKACTTTPAPTQVRSASALGEAKDDQASKAAASVAAARTANQQNPDSPAKSAVEGELSVAASNLPLPKEADAKEADARVALALTGEIAKAQLAWAKARADADVLAKKVDDLERKVAEEQAKAAAEIARIKREADERQAGFVVRVCAGVGAAVLLGSIALAAFLIWSGTANPKSLGACAIGVVSAIGCFALTQFLAHPWIPYAVGGLILLLGVIAFVMWLKSHFEVHDAKKRARAGLERVGQALGEIRATMPEDVTKNIRAIFNQKTDDDHQEIIGAVAEHTALKLKSA